MSKYLFFLSSLVFTSTLFAGHELEFRVERLEEQVEKLNQYLVSPIPVIGRVSEESYCYKVASDCSAVVRLNVWFQKGGDIVKVLKRIACSDNKGTFYVVNTGPAPYEIRTVRAQDVILFDEKNK